MRPVAVVMVDVAFEDSCEVAWTDDQQMIETFSADCANPTLRECIRVRGPHWSADDICADRPPHVVEGSGELGVAVADQVTEDTPGLFHLGGQVPGLLGDQGPLGSVVMPQRCTLRDSISMRNNT